MPISFNIPTLGAIRSEDQYTAEAFDVIQQQLGIISQELQSIQTAITDLQSRLANAGIA